MNTKTKGDILADKIEYIKSGVERGWLEKTIINEISEALADYRKPWTIGRSVNGFTLAEGQEWHRNDWTEDMLPDGWRPCLLGETGSEMQSLPYLSTNWIPARWLNESGVDSIVFHHRTRRPLPAVAKPILTPEQIADGWIEWHGGECPVWGGSVPEIMFRNGVIDRELLASDWRWHHVGFNGDIIAYRPDPYETLKQAQSAGNVIQFLDGDVWVDWGYPMWSYPPECYRVKPAPVMVPLGPEDVKCGDVLRYIAGHFPKNMGEEWLSFSINAVSKSFIRASQTLFTYERLEKDFEISRDGGKTWQKCEKEAK